MKQLKLLGFAIIAVFALSAITATAALALENPEILPNPTAKEPATFTTESVKGEKTTLESVGKSKVTCEKNTSKGEFTSANLGTATIDFIGCTESLFNGKCNSPGDAAGTILVKTADINYVDVLLGGTVLGLGLEILALEEGKNQFKFECDSGSLKITVTGSVIGEFVNLTVEKGTTVLSLFHTAELIFNQTNGKQEVQTCDLPKTFCEEGKKKFHLNSNFGFGAEESGQQTHQIVTSVKPEKTHVDY